MVRDAPTNARTRRAFCVDGYVQSLSRSGPLHASAVLLDWPLSPSAWLWQQVLIPLSAWCVDQTFCGSRHALM